LLNVQRTIFQQYSVPEQVQQNIKTMRAGMAQPSQQLLTTIEIVWRVG